MCNNTSGVTCLDSLQLPLDLVFFSWLKLKSTYGVDTLLAFLAVALVAVDVELLEVVLRVRGFVVGGGADDLKSALILQMFSAVYFW